MKIQPMTPPYTIILAMPWRMHSVLLRDRMTFHAEQIHFWDHSMAKRDDLGAPWRIAPRHDGDPGEAWDFVRAHTNPGEITWWLDANAPTANDRRFSMPKLSFKTALRNMIIYWIAVMLIAIVILLAVPGLIMRWAGW